MKINYQTLMDFELVDQSTNHLNSTRTSIIKQVRDEMTDRSVGR